MAIHSHTECGIVSSASEFSTINEKRKVIKQFLIDSVVASESSADMSVSFATDMVTPVPNIENSNEIVTLDDDSNGDMMDIDDINNNGRGGI